MFELSAGSVWLASLCAPRTRSRVALALIAGLVWAGATTVKQTGCVSLIAVTLVTLSLIILRRSERRIWALAGGLAWVGFAVGLGVVVLILGHRGTLAPAWEAVFAFNRGILNWSALAEAAMSFSRQQAGLAPVQLGLLLALLARQPPFSAGGRAIACRAPC